jgi:hypothetical protein
VRGDLLAAAISALVVTAPLLARGTPDEETYEFSIFSTLYFFRKLIGGGQPFFTPDFAFGIAIPNGQWFVRFPAALTAVFGSARVLYSSIWLLGQFVFAFFLLRLLRQFSSRRTVQLAALVTAVLSFTNLAYFYIDDWPEVFLGWCLVPLCVWALVRVIEAERIAEGRVAAIATAALAFGLLVGNGHPLHSFIWFTVIVVFLLPILWHRPWLFVPLAIVAAVAAIGASDIVVQTLRSLGSLHGEFNPLKDPTRYPTLTFRDYVTFLQPLLAVSERGWSAVASSTYGRRPFYGAVFFVLAAGGSLAAVLRPQLFSSVPNRSVVRALGFAFLGTVALTLAPSWAEFNLVGEGWHYKDGQTLFAILVAAMTLELLVRRGHARLVGALLILQVTQMVIVAAPLVRGAVLNERPLLFGRDVNRRTFWDQPAIAALRGTARVIAAGSLDVDLFSNLRAADGVVAVTDFPLENIGLVNSWYRGTVTPHFGPANDPRYGAYQTILRWADNLHDLDRDALDALGVTHLLAYANERDALQQALGLDEVARVPVSGGKAISVLRNPRAWSRAVLIAGDRPASLPQRTDCRETYVWCADFRALAARRVPDTRLRRDGDRFSIELPPGHPAGYVLLTQAIAGGWTARVDGVARRVTPVHDVFVSVDVAPADRIVELSYDSTSQAVMLAAAVGQMTICLAISVLYAVGRGEHASAL